MNLLQRARALYAAGRIHEALEAAQAVCDRSPKNPEAWWLLGCVTRHVGLPAASDDAFRRCASLTAERMLPYRVSPARFELMVREARSVLAPEDRCRLEKMMIRIAQLPRSVDVQRGTAPDALFVHRSGHPEVLTLYQVNHENRSGSEATLLALIARSLTLS